MIPTGYIVAHQWTGPLGAKSVTYSWDGGDVAEMQGRYLPKGVKGRNGERFQVGSLRLRIIDYRPEWDGYLVVRDGFGFWWPFLQLWLDRVLSRFKPRIIVTAYVWGLASWEEQWGPEWSDIHLVRKAQGLWQSYLRLLDNAS